MEIFSENEVFLTSHKDITFVDSINGPCEILTYDEYDQKALIAPNVFFTR